MVCRNLETESKAPLFLWVFPPSAFAGKVYVRHAVMAPYARLSKNKKKGTPHFALDSWISLGYMG